MWPLQVVSIAPIYCIHVRRTLHYRRPKPPLVCAPGCLHGSSLAWHGERWNLFSFCNFARSTRAQVPNQRSRRTNSTLPILAAGTHARFQSPTVDIHSSSIEHFRFPSAVRLPTLSPGRERANPSPTRTPRRIPPTKSAHAIALLTAMKAALLPRLQNINPLRLLPISTNFYYEKLPGDYSQYSPRPSFSPTSWKKYRWRSPSPGANRFPPLVKMSLSRFVVLVITTILCLGLIVVGGYRSHQRMKNKKSLPRDYPWGNFTR